MAGKPPLDLQIDDVVELRKAHPCGGLTWRILRVGADIGIECLTCQRYVLVPRRRLESRIKRFVETEQHLLKPLPDVPPELAVWATVKVHGDCHVQFEQCRYSVPHTLVHQSLWLRASDTSVRIYQAHELKAIHPRLKHPGGRSTLDAHLPPHALAYKMRDPQ